MTVIVWKNDKIYVFTKGADSIILKRSHKVLHDGSNIKQL